MTNQSRLSLAVVRQGFSQRRVGSNTTYFSPAAGALSLAALLITSFIYTGCKSTAPMGSPIQPNPLGTVVDEANRIQEQNAEQAKFIVYLHEFELNEPKKKIRNPWSASSRRSKNVLDPESLLDPTYRQEEIAHQANWELDETEPRGYRLNDYGLDHIRRLAGILLNSELESVPSNDRQHVLVERSQSSKRWDTLHHYPVHYNERLDEDRRRVVVAALESLGLGDADSIVRIAPAFPEGLHSIEAVQAYQATRFGSGGGRGGFGAGGF